VTADGPESEPAAEHPVGGIPLASLVRDFHRPMLKFARTMVNSPALAEEAVQEAWVQVLQSSSSFEGRSYLSIPVALAGAARSALPRPGQPPK
jgi:RNA polymerase sigma-70 factor, ECF subfamily